MKSNSMRYLTKEGFRNIFVNSLMSLASVTVLLSCLVIIGTAFLLFVNINAMLDGVESQNVVMVFVKDGVSAGETDTVGATLKTLDNIGEVQFVSRDEAYNDVLTGMGTDAELLEGVDSSFLPDSYKVQIKDMDSFDATVAQIKTVANVGSVRENSDLADKLTNIRNSVSYISLGIIILLFIVALFIIANTIRVTMFSRRLEINIMKSVGATNWFIRWPFIIEGITLGVISSLAAIALLYGLYVLASNSLASIIVLFGNELVPFAQWGGKIYLIFLAIGLFTGVFGSTVSMGKYLREHGGGVVSVD